jgi:4-amino-4-deoxy-L-arabinose transferase-like glycosyltransferase
MKRGLAPLVLLLLTAGIYIGCAATPALNDEADCGHAIASRELLQTGDWAVLHINGIRWLEKPPLLFWIVAASYRLLGENAFSTRLPTAIVMILLVLLLYEFGRRWFGERAGFYAGLIMATSFGVFLNTREMIAEALYSLAFTIVFYLFLRAWEGSLPMRPACWGAAAVTALAVLARGLIGVILPVAGIVLFLLVTGGWRRWRELPWLSSTLIFLAVAVPWHVIAGSRARGFYWFYFVNEHFLRAVNKRMSMDYQPVPRLLWWAEHLIWFFPWSIFIYFALRELPPVRLWRTRAAALDRPVAAPMIANTGEQRYLVEPRLLLFCWTAFIMLFFTISTRLEYYSFGAWPAIAILIGVGLADAEDAMERLASRLQGALALIGLAASAMFGALLWMSRGVEVKGDIASLLASKSQEYYRHEFSRATDLTTQAFAALRGEVIAAIIVFVLGFGAAWLLRRRQRALAATFVMALAAAGLLFATHSAMVVFEPKLSSRVLAEQIGAHLQPGDRILLYGDFYGGCTVSFYTGQKLWIWNGRYYGLAFGADYPDAPKIFLDDQQFPAFWREPERVFLVVPEDHQEDALERLPPNSTYVFARSGGKTVYVNHPVEPNEPTIAGALNR